MKKIISACVAMAVANTSLAWGFLGHKTINNRAVFALPPELFGFYKKHIDYITAHAVDPDSRRYLVEDEGCKHYLDCDHYEASAPLDTIPHYWRAAVEKYSEDTLKTYGVVPWHCLLMLRQLTRAFEMKDVPKILKYSADIGHYIADAHVPLHTTGNHNGQKTGQHGIHALWESRIPQLFLDSFDLLTGTVDYIRDPNEYIWNAVSESFAAADTVLKLEQLATERNEGNKYSFEIRGQQTVKVYSREFCEDYNRLMESMVARRMQQAVRAVAGFWYTAWVDAGQPLLTTETDTSATNTEAPVQVPENAKIKGRDEPGNE